MNWKTFREAPTYHAKYSVINGVVNIDLSPCSAIKLAKELNERQRTLNHVASQFNELRITVRLLDEVIERLIASEKTRSQL
jgi:hypothetical protein